MSKSNADAGQDNLDADQLRQKILHSNSKDEALSAAIKAAEESMRALKLAKDPTERSQLSAKVKDLLEEAEKIKQSTDWKQTVRSDSDQDETSRVSTKAPARVLREPQSTRKLPTQEQIMLLKASYLHGFKFPPWTADPEASEFDLKPGEELFLDTPDLPLSEFQEDVLSGWKRPHEALPPPSWFPGDRTNLGPSMNFSRKIDLVQDAATDCSVVASLCAGIARAEKGHKKLLRSVLHPYDSEHECPRMSANGKYIVRLNFNGCYRRVVIDDRLPVSTTSRIIHVVDRHNAGLLWPALIEKAYLKVRGGYDFPGSNSGTDIWILSGWIPEQVFLQSDQLEPDKLWRQVSNAFAYGDVLVTMGTGKMSCKAERELGLAGEHDYAVLDLKEVDGQKVFLVKNPWCEGPSWRGKSGAGAAGEDGESSSMAGVLDDLNDGEPVQNSRDLLNADDQLSPGTFWMDLDNVVQHFESIYLNWNPGLFAHRQDLHFAWDLTPSESGTSHPRGTSASLSRHPQYTVEAEKGGVIWVLLCRHFQNAVPPDATDDEIEKDRYGIELSGHMSLNAFRSKGKRVLLPDRAAEKGWYVDSPQTLLKLECEPGEIITLVPAEQELPSIRHTFTLSAFSNSPFNLAPAHIRYLHSQSYTGSWMKETAGGNAHSPTYSTNPQYSITIPKQTGISVLLETTNNELNVHFKLLHSAGKRIHSIRNKDIVFDSKDYRRGCCSAEHVDLQAGHYTIICSTFEANQYGDFTLLIESNGPTRTSLLPKEGAGRIRLALDPIAFKAGQTKLAAPLVPQRLVNLYAVARYIPAPLAASAGTSRYSSTTRPLLRMSLILGRGPEQRVLVSSNNGEYSDSAGGIRTEEVDLRPDLRRWGDIWVVVERMYNSTEGGEEGGLGVEVWSDQPNGVGWGQWREWED